MSLVRVSEEQATTLGHQLLIKESTKFAEEFWIALELSFPEPNNRDKKGQGVPLDKVKGYLKLSAKKRTKRRSGKERCSRRGGKTTS